MKKTTKYELWVFPKAKGKNWEIWNTYDVFYKALAAQTILKNNGYPLSMIKTIKE